MNGLPWTMGVTAKFLTSCPSLILLLNDPQEGFSSSQLHSTFLHGGINYVEPFSVAALQLRTSQTSPDTNCTPGRDKVRLQSSL